MGGEAHARQIQAKVGDGPEAGLHRRDRPIEPDACGLEQRLDFIQRRLNRSGNAEQFGDGAGDGRVELQRGRFGATFQGTGDHFVALAPGRGCA